MRMLKKDIKNKHIKQAYYQADLYGDRESMRYIEENYKKDIKL